MHKSNLSYSVSRNYPYKWFTPVAVIGVVGFAALFTVLNFASTGYVLKITHSHHPNDTVLNSGLGGWPTLGASKLKPTCEENIIGLNTQLYTTNSALQYTLLRVANENGTTLPALVYHNNPLQRCEVQGIQLILDLAGRTATQFGMSFWGVFAQAQVQCKASLEPSAGGMVTINLIADYNFVPPTVTDWSGTLEFPGRNNHSAASLWWGESLLSMYYVQLIKAMSDATQLAATNQDWTGAINGVVSFSRNSVTDDITSLDYLEVGFRGLVPKTDYGLRAMTFDYSSSYIDGVPISELADGHTYPDIWIPADTMAKSFESTILTDLGQADAQPNILTSPDLLQDFTTNFTQIMKMAHDDYTPLIDVNGTRPLAVGPATQDYATIGHDTGPLGVHDSTLSASYFCSVPTLKSTGDLLVSLTVADLVYLQAVWAVFTLCICYYMKKKNPTADFCEGCMPRESVASSRTFSKTESNVGDKEPLMAKAASVASRGST